MAASLQEAADQFGSTESLFVCLGFFQRRMAASIYTSRSRLPRSTTSCVYVQSVSRRANSRVPLVFLRISVSMARVQHTPEIQTPAVERIYVSSQKWANTVDPGQLRQEFYVGARWIFRWLKRKTAIKFVSLV